MTIVGLARSAKEKQLYHKDLLHLSELEAEAVEVTTKILKLHPPMPAGKAVRVLSSSSFF